jgi:tetratricopeptide (TPR) repeat protein
MQTSTRPPGETRPNPKGQPTVQQTAARKTGKQPKRKGGSVLPAWLRRYAPLAAGAVALVVLVLGTGALAGYYAGSDQAQTSRSTDVAASAQEQFDLGVQDLLAGRYSLARQRFEYVLSIDPAYPGASELLDKALVALNVPTPTASPIAAPSAPPSTPTPTLDVASLDSLFRQGQTAFGQGDWGGTLQALIVLRGKDPTFHRQEVDAMMAASLRNRGLNKILSGSLEPGIYDLSLAALYGPLDAQAQSWMNTAEFYTFADSYFDLDPALAARYFAQLCQGGTWDTCYKYAMSAFSYGDLLAATKDPCGASDQYRAALDTWKLNGVGGTATAAAKACKTATAMPPTPTETPTPMLETETVIPGETVTPSLTPTGGGATATASATATPSPTGSSPTNTPTTTGTPTPTPTLTPTATATQ